MKYSFSALFVLLIVIASSSMSYAQITTKHYKIYSTKAQKEVSINDIVEEMKSSDVLFFGEEHNDSVLHYLEFAIFEALYQKFNTQIALSLEMFDRDVQPVMNEYLQSAIREKDFIKDAKVWNNYKDYRPLVELAKKQQLDVICANAAGRYSNLAGRKGQSGLMKLPEASKNNFAPLPFDTASGMYYQKLMNLMGHNSSDTTKKSPPMGMMGGFNIAMAQSLWDATMAYSIAQYLKTNKTKKIFQVNGRFHSDEGFAIVTQLKKTAPNIKSLIISGGSDEHFPNINWDEYKHLGDFIIIVDPTIPKTY